MSLQSMGTYFPPAELDDDDPDEQLYADIKDILSKYESIRCGVPVRDLLPFVREILEMKG